MYLDCKSNLEAYLWISNIILDDNLSLDLDIVPLIYYIVIILDDKVLGKTN